jgi:hypothetical protein
MELGFLGFDDLILRKLRRLFILLKRFLEKAFASNTKV